MFAEMIEKALSRDGVSNTTEDVGEIKAKAYNSTRGTLGDVDCPICLNKGYIAHSDGKGGIRLEECECAAKRRSLKRIKKSGLEKLLQIFTFDTYETPSKWQKTAKQTAMDYLANTVGAWFVIAGTPGTGKTHLCTAICKELIDAGKDVRYMQWRQDAPRLKAKVNDREEYEDEIWKLSHTDVLYIDDFLKGTVTEADINLAFEILNARYNQPDAKTIISSEKTIEQILDVDEAIGSRIYQRSKGYRIKTPAENWRLK